MASSKPIHDIRAITGMFDMRGDFVSASVYGSGHINDTYCAWFDQAGLRVRYIVQRINHNVFKQPVLLMENVDRVTRHALATLHAEGSREAYRRTLTCIPALDGKPYALDAASNVWRAVRAASAIANSGSASKSAQPVGPSDAVAASPEVIPAHCQPISSRIAAATTVPSAMP